MKAVINRIADTIELAYEGKVGMVETLTDLEDIKVALENGLKQIKEFKAEHIDEFSVLSADYPDGYGGYRFEFRNGARRLTYKGIPEYDQAAKTLKEVESKYKQAFENAVKGLMAVDENGEVLDLPEVKYSPSSIILKPIKR